MKSFLKYAIIMHLYEFSKNRIFNNLFIFKQYFSKIKENLRFNN